MKLQSILILLLVAIVSCKNTPISDATTKVTLPYEIKTPENLTKDSPILILLHGYGSQKNDLFGFANRLDKRLVVVCPNAPINIRPGRYAWYKLNLNAGQSKYQFEDVRKAKHQILQFIKEIRQKYGLTKSKVFIGGFSQGAIMSLNVGLTAPELIDGIIALSGHLYPEIRNEIKFNPSVNELKIFVSHGKQDPVLAFEEAKNGVDYLENRGLNVDEFWYNAKHQINAENFKEMSNWLTMNLDAK